MLDIFYYYSNVTFFLQIFFDNITQSYYNKPEAFKKKKLNSAS